MQSLLYTLGIISIIGYVFSIIRMFDTRYGIQLFYELFGFLFILCTVSWSIIGMSMADGFFYLYFVVLLIELSFPIYKLFTEYDDKTITYLIRKFAVIGLTLMIISHTS